MSLLEIILEEWQKLSWFGRCTWFPVFVPPLLFTCAILLIAIPPAFLLERTIGQLLEWSFHKVKRLVYKES